MSKPTTFEFHKSSYSTAQGECVEVALNVAAVTAVRDSKDIHRPGIEMSSAAWAPFITAVKSDASRTGDISA